MDNYETLAYLRLLNKKYSANNYNGINTAGNNFVIIPGKLPILLSAPHAVRQNRDGQVKYADELTQCPIYSIQHEKKLFKYG